MTVSTNFLTSSNLVPNVDAGSNLIEAGTLIASDFVYRIRRFVRTKILNESLQ